MNLPERLRCWAQNEEMVDQHFTAHGRDCNTAADCVVDLLAALEAMAEHEGERQYSGIGTEHDSDALEAAKARARAAIAKARGA